MKPRYISSYTHQISARRAVLRPEGLPEDDTAPIAVSFNLNFRGGITKEQDGKVLNNLVLANATMTASSPSATDNSLLEATVTCHVRYEIDQPLSAEVVQDNEFITSLHEVSQRVARKAMQELLTSMDLNAPLPALLPMAPGPLTSVETSEEMVNARLL